MPSINQPVAGREGAMIPNMGGGIGFRLDPWARLRRFLILGTEGGTYYASERQLAVQNVQALRECADQDPQRFVIEIHHVSTRGLALRQRSTLAALAFAASYAPNRLAAYSALPVVCRTASHLFEFLSIVTQLRGWSRGLRSAVENWYTVHQSRGDLAYQAIKYRERNGWTHKDVLRTVHPRGLDPALAHFIMGSPFAAVEEHHLTMPASIEAFIELQAIREDTSRAAQLIADHALPWEAVPTVLHQHRDVWEALLPHMPYHAMLRNLSRFSALGMLDVATGSAARIATRLVSDMQRARVHPMHIWLARRAYAFGSGRHRAWTPLSHVTDMLDALFEMSFVTQGVATRTADPMALVIDRSGSMGAQVAGIASCSAWEGAAIMAYCQYRLADHCTVIAFSDRAHRVPITGDAQRHPDAFARQIQAAVPGGGTDLSTAIRRLLHDAIPARTVVIYTDDQINQGAQVTPLFRQYRDTGAGEGARGIAVGLTSHNVTIADVNEPWWYTAVGLDSSLPQVIHTIHTGRVESHEQNFIGETTQLLASPDEESDTE
jgi:60 kDa SS-A/Ro ribonucleoprotein